MIFIAAMLQQGLSSGGQTILSGDVKVVIPRETCPVLNYLCVEVMPGSGSSYSLVSPGSAYVVCISLTPYINCNGMCIMFC